MTKLNEKHPELLEGEVFLTNIGDPSDPYAARRPGQVRKDWDLIGHETKRLGRAAYDVDGKVVPRMRPVFVRRSELETKGIIPETEFSVLCWS